MFYIGVSLFRIGEDVSPITILRNSLEVVRKVLMLGSSILFIILIVLFDSTNSAQILESLYSMFAQYLPMSGLGLICFKTYCALLPIW